MAQEFYSFLDQNSDRKVNLTEILEKWSEPPYGIKLGLVPILAVSFYLARNDKIALFVDEILHPISMNTQLIDYITILMYSVLDQLS